MTHGTVAETARGDPHSSDFAQMRSEEPVGAMFPPTSWRVVLLAAGVIVLAAVAAYYNSFGGVFAYDDQGAIVENTTIRHLWPIGPLLSPPCNGETVGGRPLLNISLAINYAISGLNVWSYHAANLLIHIAAALLLFGILRRTFLMPALRDRFGKAANALALASTLLWTVHPLQTESVTYIVQRAESLAGLFYLLTLYSVIRGANSARSRLWYAAAIFACLLGTACKEILITAPLIVLLYDRTFLAGSFAEAWRRRWGLYLGLAATWGLLVYLVLSTGLIFRQPELEAPDAWSYARSQPGVILYYLRLSLWPDSLCMSYMWPVANTLGEILPGALVVGALLGVTLYGVVVRKPWGFLGAWFFLILAPTSTVMPLNQLIHEHRMYLPLAALAVIVVTGGHALCDRLLPRSVGASLRFAIGRWAVPVSALAAVLFALGHVTVSRNFMYRSSIAIWQDTVDKSPNHPIAQNNLGFVLTQAGRVGEAIRHYQQALQLRPGFAHAHNNLSVALADMGKTSEAIEHGKEAVRLEPEYVDAYSNLGVFLAAAGRFDEAINCYQQAFRLKPNFADVHNNWGLALAATGKTDEAIQHYHEALRLKPDFFAAHVNLGNTLAAAGRTGEAIEHYREALRLKPDDAAAHNNLGNALDDAGKADEAIEHYREALRLKPDYVEARNNLDLTLAAKSRTEESIEHHREVVAQYNQVLERLPDSIETLNELAWLLATHEHAEGGDPDRAVQLAQRARDLAGQDNAQCLDTLAAAHAAAGRFTDAIAAAEKALQLAEAAQQAALAQRIQSRLELYRAGRPYRETPR